MYSSRKQMPAKVRVFIDFYREAIEEEVEIGCEEADEIMYSIASDFRCGECKPIIERIIRKVKGEVMHRVFVYLQ